MSALVLRPEVTYGEVEQILVGLGWSGGPSTVLAPLVAGEPEQASWRRGAARLDYTCNPVVWFRHLDGQGVDAADWLVVGSRLPQLGDDEILDLLQDPSDERILLGLYAAGARGLRAAAPVVDALAAHPSPLVRSVAGAVARGWTEA